jgi:hypothetical protein
MTQVPFIPDFLTDERLCPEYYPKRLVVNYKADAVVRVPGSYLTDENIEQLKRMFATEGDYVENMRVLNVLRALLHSKVMTGKGYDIDSPYFPLMKMANEFIGALLQDGHDFDDFGNVSKL